ncbi:MAG: epimerase [Halieaceae bacterium]|nr:epimerase [Halieaceae bacterium]
MEHKSIAIIGFGDIGARVAARLPTPWRTIALRRRAREVPAGVRGIAIDLRRPETLACLERLAPDALLVTLSPAGRDPEAYRDGFGGAMAALVAGCGAHRPRQAFFVSSTRVYAGNGDAYVDESSPLALDEPQAAAIVDAEERFLGAFEGGVVLRAGGLYGHGPGPLLKAVAAGRLRPRQPLVYANRIHRDDVAGFIVHALATPPAANTINLVDGCTASQQEVEAWLCEQLRMPYDPPAAPPADASPARIKRVTNQRLRDSGYRLHYPDFRSGYADVLRQWTQYSDREDGLDLH